MRKSTKRTSSPWAKTRSARARARLFEALDFLRDLSVAKGTDHSFPARISIRVDCPAMIRRRKLEGERALAQIACHGKRTICVSSALAWTPASIELGVLAHEIGHMLADGPSQKDADEFAELLFGVKIRYVGPLRLQSF